MMTKYSAPNIGYVNDREGNIEREKMVFVLYVEVIQVELYFQANCWFVWCMQNNVLQIDIFFGFDWITGNCHEYDFESIIIYLFFCYQTYVSYQHYRISVLCWMYKRWHLSHDT